MIEWKPEQTYHVVSECGRWTVSKSMVRDVAHYTLWRRVGETWAFESMHDSFEAAKGAAR